MARCGQQYSPRLHVIGKRRCLHLPRLACLHHKHCQQIHLLVCYHPISASHCAHNDNGIDTIDTIDCRPHRKTNNDILELTELSMDTNLTGNQLKLHFQKNPVLEGVSVHETIDKVYVLVATVSSVHRFVFTHPRKLGSISAASTRSSPQSLLTSVTGIELLRPSIFYNVYTQDLDNPSNYSVLPSYGSSLGLPIPTTSCSWLTPQREAVFVIANNVGSLLVVRLGAPEDSGNP
ncbi:unnamed protein product [Medioppia subpectinata]|uniref:Nucleoporin Nup120/160 beta-propeller domain-containing protein n=1 Tax=Medioppia subpectinata TaxID=1979941 RepID=A0A7R9KDR4_9ACAR|nr:unnamed protein product [Medioppia subpectinata]CAG2101528.1 unnamed protein product [Medioppia subpectinata]